LTDQTKNQPCSGCRNGADPLFDFSMAFQPIVDVQERRVFAYEALVRGLNGESAFSVLSQVTEENRYAFDQRCRVKAIETAVAGGIVESGARLSINFLPNAVYSPVACIQLTLKTARAAGLPLDRLIFEFTENEEMMDPAHIQSIVASYQKMGFGTALDDFGAGHAGLTLLARFQPDIIKLDMELVRHVDRSLPRRMIVASIVKLCESLNILAIAEGIETEGERMALADLGVRYMQGYYFARPAFEQLPEVDYGDVRAVRAA
jgi:EAL domain-containing protein (putative c-di-GMP-specific phosphodiesterase class I)